MIYFKNIAAFYLGTLALAVTTPICAEVRSLDLPQVFGETKIAPFIVRRSKIIDSIIPAAKSPDRTREAISQIAIPTVSVVPAVSSDADLSKMGLGKGVYLPIDLRTRNSVYELQKDQSVVLGLFVTDQGVFAKRVTMLSEGKVDEGSQMRLEIVDRDGKAVQSGQGKLTFIDKNKGYGKIEVNNVQLMTKNIWIAWSFIDIEK